MIYKRLPTKKTSYTHRWNSLCRKEIRREKYLKRLLILAHLASVYCDNNNGNQTFQLIAIRYMTKYYAMKSKRTRTKHVSKTFNDFSEQDCWVRFKTRKQDLPRLLKAFKLDGGKYVADNGSKFTGEEILMIGLHRYCCVGSLYVSMSKVFDLDFSRLSRAFSIFNEHMLRYNKHGFLQSILICDSVMILLILLAL